MIDVTAKEHGKASFRFTVITKFLKKEKNASSVTKKFQNRAENNKFRCLFNIRVFLVFIEQEKQVLVFFHHNFGYKEQKKEKLSFCYN